MSVNTADTNVIMRRPSIGEDDFSRHRHAIIHHNIQAFEEKFAGIISMMENLTERMSQIEELFKNYERILSNYEQISKDYDLLVRIATQPPAIKKKSSIPRAPAKKTKL